MWAVWTFNRTRKSYYHDGQDFISRNECIPTYSWPSSVHNDRTKRFSKFESSEKPFFVTHETFCKDFLYFHLFKEVYVWTPYELLTGLRKVIIMMNGILFHEMNVFWLTLYHLVSIMTVQKIFQNSKVRKTIFCHWGSIL